MDGVGSWDCFLEVFGGRGGYGGGFGERVEDGTGIGTVVDVGVGNEVGFVLGVEDGTAVCTFVGVSVGNEVVFVQG